MYDQVSPNPIASTRWHQTDPRSVFNRYQSYHPEHAGLSLSTHTWRPNLHVHFSHVCFVLISLPLFFSGQEDALTMCACPRFAYQISLIWIRRARGLFLSYLPQCQGCWLGVLPPLGATFRVFSGQLSSRFSEIFLGEIVLGWAELCRMWVSLKHKCRVCSYEWWVWFYTAKGGLPYFSFSGVLGIGLLVKINNLRLKMLEVNLVALPERFGQDPKVVCIAL